MYLVLSTLPHLFSIVPLLKYYKEYTAEYIHIIVASTLFFVLYHVYEEANLTITVLDYACAALWLMYDIYMGYTYTDTLSIILLGNTITFLINIQIPYTADYPIVHSLWHFTNAYKSFYVSSLISTGIANNNILQ
jgi:hypothetical protein